MMDMTETLEGFTTRADQLRKICEADPQRFGSERDAISRAEAILQTAKSEAAVTIARREQHTGMIEAAHKTGALNEWERGKIFERYASDYATQNIDEAQAAADGARDSFWNALKKAERQALQNPQAAA